MFYHGHSIVMNDKDDINIAQYVGVVDIYVSVKFWIDSFFWVRWAWVVPHVSYKVR